MHVKSICISLNFIPIHTLHHKKEEINDNWYYVVLIKKRKENK